MGDWAILIGAGAVLFWGGAWLLVHLGNFETRLSQLRQLFENRLGSVERNFQAQIKQMQDGQNTLRVATIQIKELQDHVTALKAQLEDAKKAQAVLEASVTELRVKALEKKARAG